METLSSQIRNMWPNRPRRGATQVFAAAAASLLVLAVCAGGSKSGSAPSLQDKALARLDDAQGEEQRIGDFMQKVARAHVGRLDPQERVDEHAEKTLGLDDKADPKTIAAVPPHKPGGVGKAERTRVAALTQKPAATPAAATPAPVASAVEAKAETKETAPGWGSRIYDSMSGAVGMVSNQQKRVMDGISYVTNAVASLAKK